MFFSSFYSKTALTPPFILYWHWHLKESNILKKIWSHLSGFTLYFSFMASFNLFSLFTVFLVNWRLGLDETLKCKSSVFGKNTSYRTLCTSYHITRCIIWGSHTVNAAKVDHLVSVVTIRSWIVKYHFFFFEINKTS